MCLAPCCFAVFNLSQDFLLALMNELQLLDSIWEMQPVWLFLTTCACAVKAENESAREIWE